MRHILPFASVIAIVLLACGGSVNGIDGTGSSSSSSGSSGASGSSSSGSSGSSGSGSNCTATVLDTNRICVPGTAAANQPLELQIDETEGCLACFTNIDKCVVSVNGSSIALSMAATQCHPTGEVGCPAVCGVQSVKCTIPPLAPGKYTVTSSSAIPRDLVVVASGGASSCSLSGAGAPSPQIDLSKYGATCSSDSECRAVIGGDACARCSCPNGVISTSASDAYDADLRAARSQCVPPAKNAGDVVCGPCKMPEVKCEGASPGSAGHCVLE